MLIGLALTAAAAPIDDLIAWAEDHPAPSNPPEEVDGYGFLADHLLGFAAEAERRPAAVEIAEIGRTTWDNPIWAVTVAEPGSPVEEEVLIFAGIHALEWISVEVAFALLEELVARPPRGISVTVVPCLNVDGRLKTEGDVAMQAFGIYRRGNGAEPPVDLNRDFAIHRDSTSMWRHILPGYHSTTAEGSLSQPESQAIDTLAADGDYDRAASLHAFGGYHYYPWSGRWTRPDDHERFVELGREMEAAQGPRAYRPRQLSRWGFFFRAQGTEIDHLYGEHGIQAFLIELTRSGLRPTHLPKDRRLYFRWYNPVRPARHVEKGVAALRALIRGA